MKTLLIACVAALASCASLSDHSPVVLHVEFDGQGALVSDLGAAVVVGNGSGYYELRAKGSPIPLQRGAWDQDGDYTVIAQDPETGGVESHHHAYGSTNVLPAAWRAWFTPAFLAAYPLRFEGDPVP